MKKFIPLICLSLLVAASCAKETVIEKPDEGPQLVLVGDAALPTKTSIGEESGGIVPFLWKGGDKLGLFVNVDGEAASGQQNISAIVQSIVDGTGPGYNKGYFKSSMTVEAGKNYDILIAYPYTAESGSRASLKYRIPSVQIQAAAGDSRHLGVSGGFAVASASFSTPATLEEDYTPELVFSLAHKTSYVWLRLASADAALDGWKVRSIKLTAPEDICGQTTYVPSTGVLTLSEGANTVTLDIPEGITLEQGSYKDAYLVVFPAEMAAKTLKFTYTLESSTGVRVVTHTKTLSEESMAFTKGSVHRFTEEIPSADESGWAYHPAGAVDLSADGTSNCYVVSAPGEYSFDASVIGNGQEGILLPLATTLFHTDNPALAPASAELLWQSAPGIISDVSLSAGKISFTRAADAEPGNAVIAAKDDGGNIIWSWHIWCTELGAAQLYVSPNNSYVVMDRNLGATYASSAVVKDDALQKRTIGLFYQYGRKDPLVGVRGLSDAENTLFAQMYDKDGNEITRPEPEEATSTTGTIEYAAAHPMTHLHTTGTPNDWFLKYGTDVSTRGYYLWGHPKGHDYTSASPSTPQKTVYDPCPPGWMVSPQDMWNALKYGSGLKPIGATYKYDGTHTTWYPMPGRLDPKTGAFSYVGTLGHFWSAGYGKDSSLYPVRQRLQRNSPYIDNDSSSWGYWGGAYAFNIRCVQEIK